MEKLLIHLKMLPDTIKCKHPHISQVTRVQTICEVLNENDGIKHLLSEVHKLVKLFLTIPVTTAIAERGFSTLKRIKTYLRNSKSQEKLNHCLLDHVHQQKIDELELCDIAKDFISRNERRMNYLETNNSLFCYIHDISLHMTYTSSFHTKIWPTPPIFCMLLLP